MARVEEESMTMATPIEQRGYAHPDALVSTDWVEQHSNWQESLLIVTADHGHMLNILRPEALCAQ